MFKTLLNNFIFLVSGASPDTFEMIMDYYHEAQEILANNTFQEYGVVGLFLNSLLSATAIPLPTEILTSALLMGGESEYLIMVVLILGSSIGGIMNYFLGFGGNRLVRLFKKKKKTELELLEEHHAILGNLVHRNEVCQTHSSAWIAEMMKTNAKMNILSKEPLVSEKKGNKLLDKFGWGAVFFSSWIPVAGDLILISAGVKRFAFRKFFVLMILGKTVKTITVVAGMSVLF